MTTTGKLGTFLSRPGSLAPGAPVTSDYVAWQGPFSPAELYAGGTLTRVTRGPNAITVTPAIASQISASDPTWWAYA